MFSLNGLLQIVNSRHCDRSTRDYILAPGSREQRPCPQRETPPDKEYAEYDPVEGVGGFWRSVFGVTNADIAATGAKINTHVPTPDEIAKHKYVICRYWSGPRWMRRLFGTDEYSPR